MRSHALICRASSTVILNFSSVQRVVCVNQWNSGRQISTRLNDQSAPVCRARFCRRDVICASGNCPCRGHRRHGNLLCENCVSTRFSEYTCDLLLADCWLFKDVTCCEFYLDIFHSRVSYLWPDNRQILLWSAYSLVIGLVRCHLHRPAFYFVSNASYRKGIGIIVSQQQSL